MNDGKKQLAERKIRDAVNKYNALMVTMQRELMDAGLIATAAQVNQATHKLGWEASRLLDRINPPKEIDA